MIDNNLEDVIVENDVMIAMRDGISLATDLYFPARHGHILPRLHPALIHRTPYNKNEVEASLGYCRYFAQRGFVAVIQDSRGTFGSEGEVDFLVPEAEDGYDTLAWLGLQNWTNGKVGSWGTSWSGWTQTAMAALSPSNLTSMIPNMSGSDAHESSVRQGGALELRFLAWAFWHSATNTQRALKRESHVDAALNLGAPSFTDWLTCMPIRKGQTQLKVVPSYERWALKIQTESDFTDYWKHPSLAPALYWDRFPDIPVLLVGGWYDSYTRSTFCNFAGLTARKRGPIRVLVGPWTHGSNTVESSHAGDVEFGSEAVIENFRDLHLRWFEWTLKGKCNKLTEISPVQIFVMGGGGGYRSTDGRLFHGGRWRNENEWPLARTQYTTYYLHGGGGLSPQKANTHVDSTTYCFDPSNPVPSIGGNVSSLVDLGRLPTGVADSSLLPRAARTHDIMIPGGFDQTESAEHWGCVKPFLPLGSRADIVVFQTPPLVANTELTGPVEVHLWVSSSAPDTDFTAKLIDLYPPSQWYPQGYALNLTDSITRLRYRNGRQHGELLTPGEIARVTVTLYPTSNLFVAGHCIRLDISSSNFPRFDVNPNTGDAIGTERRRRKADNTVYHSISHPSHAVLPIIAY